jgi:hypothetical protein
MNACVGDEGRTELPGVAGVIGHWFPNSCAAFCATHLVNDNFRSHLHRTRRRLLPVASCFQNAWMSDCPLIRSQVRNSILRTFDGDIGKFR